MKYTRLWVSLGLVFVLSFAVLGYYGGEIYQSKPPIPKRVITTTGNVLFAEKDILDGQNVWQSMGGQEIGTVWGHGAYVAPDWTADWLHRESLWILDSWANREFGNTYDTLDDETQAALRSRLQKEMRTNTYDPNTGDLVISPIRAQAFAAISQHYTSLFTNDPKFSVLRDDYAIHENAIKDLNRVPPLNAFLWWATWSCTTNRPGDLYQ